MNVLRVLRFTISDIIRHKSFAILLGIGVLLVFLLRGCYSGSYVVNGERVDSVTVAWHASRIAFHLIASMSLVLTALLSMGIFRRAGNEGITVLTLARPVTRWEFALGTFGGLSIVMILFMNLLHVAIFAVTYFSAGGVMPGFLTASVVCSLNILLMASLVMMLSFFLPDFMAALAGLAVAAISFATDSAYRILQSDVVQQAFQGEPNLPPVWRGVIAFWPKFNALQTFAISLTGGTPPRLPGPVHPALNVGLFAALCTGILLLRFRRQEF